MRVRTHGQQKRTASSERASARSDCLLPLHIGGKTERSGEERYQKKEGLALKRYEGGAGPAPEGRHEAPRLRTAAGALWGRGAANRLAYPEATAANFRLISAGNRQLFNTVGSGSGYSFQGSGNIALNSVT
ncbi:hypothetical protein NDU88_007851 [Pleurodeles waltl]|uniref:Uncharacterized protein n=1 Tax=Pleurodeles waltl TaxID=8319 RepID=A0AAV7STZ4_PLEWA|nr:hypothetical protein NDU88_007851 [Pleurodeles waltl]